MTPAPTAAASPAEPAVGGAAVHSRSAALVLLVLLSLVWGFHWVVVKVGLDYMPPFTYAGLRVGAGLATMVVLLGAQRRLRLPARSDLSIVVSVGLGQIAAGVLIMNLALQVVPAGRSAVLVYSMPLWVAVLLAAFFGVRLRRAEIVGLALGITGILALLNPAAIDWSAPGEVLGTVALLLNAVLWAAVTIHVRRHHWTANPLELQPWQLLVAFVPLAILALALEPGRSIRWEPVTVLILLFSGPLATAFATWASQSGHPLARPARLRDRVPGRAGRRPRVGRPHPPRGARDRRRRRLPARAGGDRRDVDRAWRAGRGRGGAASRPVARRFARG